MKPKVSLGKSPRDIMGNPPEDRRAQYAKIVGFMLDRIEDLKKAGKKRQANALMLMIDGGACPHCGISWVPVFVDNVYAVFKYFKPGCDCFPKCRRCGYQAIQEVEGGLSSDKCPNCEE